MNQKKQSNIRWWNIIYMLMILVALTLASVVIFIPDSRNGFIGNVMSDIIGTVIGILISYITYQYFIHEKFKPLMNFSGFKDPFSNLKELTLELTKLCELDPTAAKNGLITDHILILKKAASQINITIMSYQKFLSLDDLRELSICLEHVISLSEIDKNIDNIIFMERFIIDVLFIYLKSNHLTNSEPNQMTVDKLWDLWRMYLIKKNEMRLNY